MGCGKLWEWVGWPDAESAFVERDVGSRRHLVHLVQLQSPEAPVPPAASGPPFRGE